MKLVTALAIAAVLATGCFHWVPLDDANQLHGERARVVDGAGERVVDHACAAAAERPIGCVVVDTAHQRVYVRRFDAAKTAIVIGGSLAFAFVGLLALARASAGVAGG
jgi:hypothetical protein